MIVLSLISLFNSLQDQGGIFRLYFMITLSRKQILRSRSLIQKLHREGKNLRVGCLRAIFLDVPCEGECPVLLVGFNVSKRYFRRAVDRNLLKRRMRESYRTQQYILNTSAHEIDKESTALPLNTRLIFFHYAHARANDYVNIAQNMEKLLRMLSKEKTHNVAEKPST